MHTLPNVVKWILPRPPMWFRKTRSCKSVCAPAAAHTLWKKKLGPCCIFWSSRALKHFSKLFLIDVSLFLLSNYSNWASRWKDAFFSIGMRRRCGAYQNSKKNKWTFVYFAKVFFLRHYLHIQWNPWSLAHRPNVFFSRNRGAHVTHNVGNSNLARAAAGSRSRHRDNRRRHGPTAAPQW